MDEPIKRRDFLAASLAATYAAGVTALPASAAEPAEPNAGGTREFYELRQYHLRRGPMTNRADDYFRDALIPAIGRLGCGPVGVFNVVIGPENPSAYVLIAHPSIESFISMPAKLAADEAYRKAGATFLEAPATDPSYVVAESSLMHAFPQMPKLEMPTGTAKNEPRIFELRTYRSPSEPAHVKKVEMFEKLGEIAIFKRVGLRPVFFAQNFVGANLPSLTYMVTFPDLATREKCWNTFRADAEWKKVSATPGYTDPEIVAAINNVILAPTPYSQI